MEEGLLSLKWNNHKSAFFSLLGVLREKNLFTDAIIACKQRFFKVHKLVLMACSDFFCEVFEQTSCQNPVIVLSDMTAIEIEALLDYMYLGEVDVAQTCLPSLIKAAETLRIKGLAVSDADLSPNFPNSLSGIKAKKPPDGADSDMDSSLKAKFFSKENEESPKKSSFEKKGLHISHKKRKLEEHSAKVSDSESDAIANVETFIKDERTDVLIKSEVSDSGENSLINYNGINDLVNTSTELLSHSLAPIFEAGPSGVCDNERFSQSDISENSPDASMYATSHLLEVQSTPADMQGVYDFSPTKRKLKPGTGHSCPYCGRIFTDRYKRDRHVFIHTGEKPFSCPFCEYKSSRKDPVIRHIKLRHVDRELMGNFNANASSSTAQSQLGSLEISTMSMAEQTNF